MAQGFDAVKKSLQQMSGNDPIHKPIIGRIVLTAMRTAMRVVNHIPALKRRMERAESEFRGAERNND